MENEKSGKKSSGPKALLIIGLVLLVLLLSATLIIRFALPGIMARSLLSEKGWRLIPQDMRRAIKQNIDQLHGLMARYEISPNRAVELLDEVNPKDLLASLEKVRKDRYADTDQLIDDLCQGLDTEGIDIGRIKSDLRASLSLEQIKEALQALEARGMDKTKLRLLIPAAKDFLMASLKTNQAR